MRSILTTILTLLALPPGTAQEAHTEQSSEFISQALQAARSEFSCEFTVLWEHKYVSTGFTVIRVHSSGEQCNEALQSANDFARDQKFVFLRLPQRQAVDARAERSGEQRTERPPPDDFTLLNEVID